MARASQLSFVLLLFLLWWCFFIELNVLRLRCHRFAADEEEGDDDDDDGNCG